MRAGWGLGVRVWREAKSKIWEVGGKPKGGRRAKMREEGGRAVREKGVISFRPLPFTYDRYHVFMTASLWFQNNRV